MRVSIPAEESASHTSSSADAIGDMESPQVSASSVQSPPSVRSDHAHAYGHTYGHAHAQSPSQGYSHDHDHDRGHGHGHRHNGSLMMTELSSFDDESPRHAHSHHQSGDIEQQSEQPQGDNDSSAHSDMQAVGVHGHHKAHRRKPKHYVVEKFAKLKHSLSTYVPRVRIIIPKIPRPANENVWWWKYGVFPTMIYLEKLKGIPGQKPPGSPPKSEIWFTFVVMILALFTLSFFSWNIFPESLMTGSFASSAALIFANPANANAQPRSVILSHTIAAFIGNTIRVLLIWINPDQLYGFGSSWYPLFAASAVALTAAVMQILRIMHPPACSTALIAIQLGGALERELYGYVFVVFTCLLGSIVLVVFGIILNNLKKARQYPVYW
eukprot:ANDGO_06416.mRNA.1 Transmembrane protein DDB_G0269096